MARNPSTQVALQEINRASGLVLEARSQWLPTLMGNGLYTRLDRSRVFNGMVATPATQWNGNLLLTVPLVAPKAWVADLEAQDVREVARLNAADVRRQLATAVGRAYLTVLLGHRELEVSARATQTSLAHYEFAHTRLTTGLGNAVDDARAEQALRTDQADQETQRTNLVRAQTALAILLSEEDLVDVVDEVQLPLAPTPQDAIAQGRASRADVRVLEGRQAAATRQRRDVWAWYLPSLVGQVQAFRQTRTLLLPERGWQAMVVLEIPFFDGGFRLGMREERRALEEEARINLEAQLRQVSVEVRAAFTVVRNADESLRAARAAAVAARAAADLADKAYRAGSTTNLEVIDAVRQARDAESRVAIAEDACRQARLDLVLATGAFP
jgi:outer membrane protein TolC